MYLNKENTLCFSGHKSEKLPKTDAEIENLKLRIWEEVDKAIYRSSTGRTERFSPRTG